MRERQPNLNLLFAEPARVVAELATLIASAPMLSLAPRGDRHPVLVMPGFGAGDRSTQVLRGYLGSLGYRTNPWNLGRNLGPAMPDLLPALTARLDEVFAAGGERKVSLIGWSLGGVYARLLAHLEPHKVRQVITLGSPFAGLRSGSIDTGAARSRSHLGSLVSQALPGIPSSAVFSRSDVIVPWHIATQTESAIAENIEVFASHIALGFSPAVLYACADRLAQADGSWRAFEVKGWKQSVFGPANLHMEPAAGRAAV
ncbi:MAG: alpha/beta hydrolase [Proteobacteria bacterium]|nr:alpha/beta hydrolase [Pseudomonadota bacterium]